MAAGTQIVDNGYPHVSRQRPSNALCMGISLLQICHLRMHSEVARHQADFQQAMPILDIVRDGIPSNGRVGLQGCVPSDCMHCHMDSGQQVKLLCMSKQCSETSGKQLADIRLIHILLVH